MQGRIVSNVSNTYFIEYNGALYEAVARGKMKLDDITPIVGDNVEFEKIENENKTVIITKILERTNYIKRPKIANITRLVFVVSMKMPKPDLLLLDKQLAFSEFIGITPIIILNKLDLVEDIEVNEIKKIYENIGYKVIITSAKNKEGIEELKRELEGQISAFAGNSGVGKSTLLNAILGDNLTKEGEISNKNKKGKNTTTISRLYKIKDNTYIADTPGFSTFDIGEIESKELFKYFKDLKQYEVNCEFVGCSHVKEEKCGIRQALSEGKIAKSRYENYVKIYEDLKDKEAHKW